MPNFRLTYFQFDALAWLQSEPIQEMEDWERGQYISLLAHAWLTDQDCSVPSDTKKLLKYCNAREMSQTVLAKFPIIEDANDPQVGRRRNRRQYEDCWLKSKAKCDKATNAGRKSGAARAQRATERALNERSTTNGTEIERAFNERSTNVEQTLNHINRYEQNINTHTPTAPKTGAAGAGVCASVSLLDQLLAALPMPMMSATLGEKEQAELQRLLDAHGEMKIAGTIRAWWAEVECDMDGYRNKWQACLKVLPAWLLKSGDEYAKAERDRRYQESPQGIEAKAAAEAKLHAQYVAEQGVSDDWL